MGGRCRRPTKFGTRSILPSSLILPPSLIVFEDLSIFCGENQLYKPQKSLNLTFEFEWASLSRCGPSTPPLFEIWEMLTWFREFRTSYKCRVRQSTYQSCLLRRTTWGLHSNKNRAISIHPPATISGNSQGTRCLCYRWHVMGDTTTQPPLSSWNCSTVIGNIAGATVGTPPEIPSGAGTSNDSRHRGWRACGGVACSSATLSQTPCAETRPRRRERSRTRNHQYSMHVRTYTRSARLH